MAGSAADAKAVSDAAAAADTEEGIPPADLKIILLGDSAVGKSKILERYLVDAFKPRTRSTYALTLYRHNVKVDGKDLKVDFWDTAGQERFASMHPSYYYKAHACILVFDVTRKITYTNLQAWYSELRQYCESIPVMVIANKIDVDYTVTSKAFAFPQKHNLPFFFVSAADGTNVVRIFDEMCTLGWRYKENLRKGIASNKDFMSEVYELLDDKALGQFGEALYGKEGKQEGSKAGSGSVPTQVSGNATAGPQRR